MVKALNVRTKQMEKMMDPKLVKKAIKKKDGGVYYRYMLMGKAADGTKMVRFIGKADLDKYKRKYTKKGKSPKPTKPKTPKARKPRATKSKTGETKARKTRARKTKA